MLRNSLIIAWLLGLLCRVGTAGAGNESLSTFVSEWKDEALFDSTTTRGELLEMGRAAAGMEHFPLAEIYLQEVLLRNPQDVDAMCELALLYKRTGRLEYARGLLTRAARLSPMRTDIVEARAGIDRILVGQLAHAVDSLMAAGRHHEALPRIAILLSIDGQNTKALTDKARCLAAAGETDAALSALDLAITREPSAELHALRAELAAQVENDRLADMESSARRLIESGDWVHEEATDVLQAILAQDPSNAWAREQFRRLSDPQAARDAARDSMPARSAMGRALHEAANETGAFLDRYLAAIIALLVTWALVRSRLPQALASRLREQSPLSGDLAQVELAAVLRTVNDAGMTGMLVLKTPDGPARVYCDRGEMIHCEAGERMGLPALENLLHDLEAGTFAMRRMPEGIERTIDQSFEVILVNANPEAAAAMGVAAAQRPRKSRMAELLETKSE
jgi:tetratricopeptide (TPR) repeat protein